MTEEIKQEVLKRYEYLYQNIEIVLSLCIHRGTEVKEITRRLENLKNTKKNLKTYMTSNEGKDLAYLVDVSIKSCEEALKNPEYYLFDAIDSDLELMLEAFLFTNLGIEETELYKSVEEIKNNPELFEHAMKKVNGVKSRRNKNRLLRDRNPFTMWRIFNYVRKANINNDSVLKALDVYYNLDRFIRTGFDWKSGYILLHEDEINNEEYLNNECINYVAGNVETPHESSAVIVDYRGNEFEAEDDYYVFEWLEDESDQSNKIKFCKSYLMECLLEGEIISIEDKRALFNKLKGIEPKTLKLENNPQ